MEYSHVISSHGSLVHDAQLDHFLDGFDANSKGGFGKDVTTQDIIAMRCKVGTYEA